MHPYKRHPRTDDPDHYYRPGEGWIRKTVWTVDNEPSCSDRAYGRFIEETTSEQRAAITRERLRRYAEEMKSKGFVQWRDAWVTPGRAEELQATYLENMRRGNRAGEERRRLPSWWIWY